MLRKLLLTVLTGVGLLVGMAAVSAADARPAGRDRDGDHRDYRDRDRHDDRDRDRGDPRTALPDPGNLVNFRGQNGQVFYFRLTGDITAGQVWGTGLYTDDSALAAAVVHAGVLDNGETGIVKVTILAGAPGYKGTVRNGVATGDWGGWDGSFRVER